MVPRRQLQRFATVGSLLGTRLVLNEFIAFAQLGPLRDASESAVVRGRDLCAVRVCEFKFHRDPDRWNRRARARSPIRLGQARPARRMAGTMANFMTACIAECCSDMRDAVALIRTRTQAAPKIGVVLGSGLGDFARELENATEIPYADIPGWPPSTAIGHAGKLYLGKLNGLKIAVMAGRNHLYEGYTAAQVTYGVRVLFGLGVRSMVFTNAAGGINLDYKKGALVLISDHINLQGANPLTGPNDETLGPAFPI